MDLTRHFARRPIFLRKRHIQSLRPLRIGRALSIGIVCSLVACGAYAQATLSSNKEAPVREANINTSQNDNSASASHDKVSFTNIAAQPFRWGKTLLSALFHRDSKSPSGKPDRTPSSDNQNPMVTLRGQVESTELRDVTTSGVSLVVKLKLELHNNGSTPVIVLNDPGPTITGAALNKVASDPPHSALVSDYRGPSVDTSSKWLTLRRSLDKAQPPSGLVRILSPGESWWFEDSVGVGLPTEAGKSSYIPRRSTWESIQELSPVWLHVNCEVWPLNVEPSKNPSNLRFGLTLRRRWEDVGLLLINGIYSEPIMIDVKPNVAHRRAEDPQK